VSIEELWRQVAESADDLSLRLILADALIERGDPRGELIALQCGGADASVMVDDDRGIETRDVGERVSELIAANWERWLGDLALVLVRRGSSFKNGLLHVIQVGEHTTTASAWESAGRHHELCAVHRVRPYRISADHYATFLAAFARDPECVEIAAPGVILGIAKRRSRWAVRNVRIGGSGWWNDEHAPRMVNELAALAKLAPEVECIEIAPTYNRTIGLELVGMVPALPAMFPRFQRIKIENSESGWLQDAAETELERIRQLPFVELT
jgi:uncharacterized protein (TIGR02996 family)